MSPLWLIRHGATTAPREHIIGQTDVPLSTGGQADAEALAARVAKAWHGLADADRPQRIVSSDARRARATAQPLADALGLSLHTDARLRELDFGDWEGRTWDAVHAEQPAVLARWGADWLETAPPGGESFRQLVARAEDWLAETDAALAPTVVVAHAGSLRALICAALDLPPAHAFALQIDRLGVTSLLPGSAGGRVLTGLNCTQQALAHAEPASTPK